MDFFAPTASRTRHYHTLDGMRGLAAILVMVYHYFQTPDTRWLGNTFIAVDFFFILSGFVIMHSYGDRLAAGMPKLLYAARRLVRIYPLVVLGLLLGCLDYGIYPALTVPGMAQKVVHSTLWNLLFLPSFRGPEFMSQANESVVLVFPANTPLWSISLEMAASLAFIYLFRLSRLSLLAICAACLALMVGGGFYYARIEALEPLRFNVGWNTYNFFGGLPRVFYGFCCGMLLYKLRSSIDWQRWPLLRRRKRLTVVALYVAWIGCLLFPHVMHGLFFLLAITVLAPVLILLASEVELGEGLWLRVIRFLGALSYPLYCVHIPVQVGVEHALKALAPARLGTSFPGFVSLAIAVPLAVLATKFYDVPVRSWLSRRLDRLAGAAGR